MKPSDKPGQRIALFELIGIGKQIVNIPDCDDVRREINVLSDRLDAQQEEIKTLVDRVEAQSLIIYSMKSKYIPSSLFSKECNWSEPDAVREPCKHEYKDESRPIPVQTSWCQKCGYPYPHIMEKFKPANLTEKKEEKRLASIYFKNAFPAGDFEKQVNDPYWHKQAKSAIDEVERVINQIGYERFHTAVPMYAHNIITALRKELL